MRNKLYYYRNKDEFDKFYNDSQKKILTFEFVETKRIIEDELNNVIDITNMVAYTDTNQANIYSAIVNLRELDDRNQLIINKDWYEKALYYFPTIFNEAIPLFDVETSNEICLKSCGITLFYYSDTQYENLLEYTQQNKIIVTNFASLQKYTNCDNEIILDITSTISSIKGSPQLIYLLEQYFASSKDNIKVIVNYNKLDEVKENFRLVFTKCQNVSDLYCEITNVSTELEKDDKPVKIIDLTKTEINNVFDNINNKLIGHAYFKSKLISQLEKFLVLNKIGERKIFSMFLLGKPGLGKTEIGKIISRSLNPNSKIIKINFGNYSSQDALNSLIGSPAGYIGCEGGELSKKVNLNKVGLIICDEIEKADSEIKNFFLELLEDGKFTDSMSREYDLNGYIVVFTSNIQNENEFKNRISPEFESRVNMICEFTPLSLSEKKEYINFQINDCIEKMKKEGIEIKFKTEDIAIPYNDTDDLREIKNRILNKISEYV